MSVTATLNATTVLSCSVDIPAQGIWHAWAETDGDATFAGQVTLKIADATYVGTIKSGGVRNGRGQWRIAGGGGGWSNDIPSKAYASDAGVKVQTVLEDAAAACGERLRGTTTARLGSHYVRAVGPASDALSLVPSWYMSEDGYTVLGQRAASTLASAYVVLEKDSALQCVKVASEAIAAIVPGATVEGIAAVDVRHTLSKQEGLRTTVWGTQQTNQWRDIILAALPQLRYAGMFEYRVVTQEGNRLNLQCVRSSLGLPDLRRVPYSPGVPGVAATVMLGAIVLVAFVNSDPSRPIVIGFADPDSPGHPALTLTITSPVVTVTGAITAAGIAAPLTPPASASSLDISGGAKPVNISTTGLATITIGGGIAGVARIGDAVVVDPVTHIGTITSGSTKVLAG